MVPISVLEGNLKPSKITRLDENLKLVSETHVIQDDDEEDDVVIQ